MSPQVSVPRRRLPTTSKSTPRRVRCADSATMRSATSAASASRWRLACCRRSSSARSSSCSLRAPMPLSARSRPPSPPPRDRRARRSAARGRAARRSSARRPCSRSRSRSVGGNCGQQLLVDAAGAGLGRSRGCGPTGPCRCPASRAAALRVRPATGSGLLATTSAALRYARILNGLSPFSSSRSAISPRMRAIDEVVERHRLDVGDIEAQPFASRCGNRAGARRRRRARRAPPATRVGRRQAEQAPAAAGAAHLRRLRRRRPSRARSGRR